LAHRAHDCLPARVDLHVLDGNFLLALRSIALQCLGLGREGSQQFHSEISVAVLLGYHVRPFQAAQRTCRSEMHRNRPVACYWLQNADWQQNYRFPVARAFIGGKLLVSTHGSLISESYARIHLNYPS
jgi:hypothetical protein